jgi:YD repeat-containing protein
VAYAPFGPATATTYGNGRVLTRTFDAAYRPELVTDSASGGMSEDYSLDAGGNVTGVTERSTLVRSFEYDGQDRLKAMKNAGSTVEAFTYDSTGNRTSKTLGAATSAYTYPTTNHRLTNVANQGSRIYDASGNTTLVNTGAPVIYTYDDRGRMRTVTFNGALQRNYRYNGKGERVLRIVESGTSQSLQFVYDEAGHLLGEYTTAGTRVAEYVWMDDTLVGVLRSHDGTTFQYV